MAITSEGLLCVLSIQFLKGIHVNKLINMIGIFHIHDTQLRAWT